MGAQYKIYRDSTELKQSSSVQFYQSAAWSGNLENHLYLIIMIMHTVQQVKLYKFQFRNPHNSGTITNNPGTGLISSISAWEYA